MDRYNMIQALWMSFYSKKLYRDVAVNWGGKALVYLFFLLILSWIYPAFNVHRGLNVFYAMGEETMLPQIPVLEVKNGEITTPEAKPYFIVTPDKKSNLIVVDTTGQFQSLTDAKSPVLITKNQIIMASKNQEARAFNMPTVVNGKVDPTVISGYIKKMLWLSWLPLLFIFTFASFIYRLIQAALYAMIGKLFALMVGTKINYMQIIQVAMVSITPVIIICSISRGFGLSVPGESLFYFGLALLYLFYGIVANRTQAD